MILLAVLERPIPTVLTMLAGAAALTALEAGRGDGAAVTVRPADGERFQLMLQRSVSGPQPVPVPLELPGFPEPR